MNRITHFEIPSNDPERDIAFFSRVFGWTFHKWDGPVEYWLVSTGDAGVGINGGLMRRMDPAQPIVNMIQVESADATASLVETAGGTVVVPKMAVPGVGWLFYFKDPDGNIHGAMQEDPAAA
ncbi:MAG: VOC family protein [Fimbriimonadaceae bacterium]|nr:VOC family protein [Fimbriimonadaceae bacterium]